MASAKENVIVALDGISRSEALGIAQQLAGTVWGFKVNDLLLDCGIEIISELKKYGKVFADAKLYDIPNTVKNYVAKLDAVGADLITIHASGGGKMIEAAVSQTKSARILTVTALTSFSAEELFTVYRQGLKEFVLAAATLAAESGAYGLVCSPEELKLLKDNKLIKVTPGIRPAWHGSADDQTRVATPAETIRHGSSLLVIGRPILTHSSPQEAVRLIDQELTTS